MSPVKEQKCPRCAAPLRFDPLLGKLFCDSCGSRFDPEDVEKADLHGASPMVMKGFDFNTLTENAARADSAPLPIYGCVSCGAEVIVPDRQAALTCPYCGNNIVLTEKVSGSLRPDGIIPFKIDPASLPDAVKRFYKGKKLLPKNFFSQSRIGTVTGIYVPFWVFNGRLYGQVNFLSSTSSSSREGDYLVTRTSYYDVLKEVDMSFRDIPVDAAGTIEDKMTDSLEPFDMSEVKPFDERYLAGFAADRFDESKSRVENRARSRMARSASSVIGTGVSAKSTGQSRSYSDMKQNSGSLNTDISVRYVLFPVYMFDLEVGKQRYKFTVNGQTGKVVGDLPTDKKTSAVYLLRNAGITAAAVFLLMIVKYLLGW